MITIVQSLAPSPSCMYLEVSVNPACTSSGFQWKHLKNFIPLFINCCCLGSSLGPLPKENALHPVLSNADFVFFFWNSCKWLESLSINVLMCLKHSHLNWWKQFTGGCAISHPSWFLLPSAQWWLLVLVRAKAWAQSLFGPFGLHGEIFWSGATKQNLNPAQSSWTCIRGRPYMSQCIRSAGNQGPGPQEGIGHFLDPAGFVPCVPQQAGQKRCDRQGPAQDPPGGVLRLAPHPLRCVYLWLGTYCFFLLFCSLCHAVYEILVPWRGFELTYPVF